MDDDEYDDEGSEQVGSALRTALVAIVLIGVVIALGTTIVVRALGLDEGGSSARWVGLTGGDNHAVATTALPVPDDQEPRSPRTRSRRRAVRAGSSSPCRR